VPSLRVRILNLRLLLPAALYLTYVIPSLYATAATLELVLRMGHDHGMYSDYGTNANEVLTAYTVLAVNLSWLALGTIISVRVFKYEMKLYWRVLILVLAWVVILPFTVLYLLGVGHS